MPAGAEAQGTKGVARAATTFPYKGLAAFQPEDAALFFGRVDLVDQLIARLQQRAVLVVGGPSGSGKSSLVRAGLLPALAAGALPGSEGWRVCLMTPGERPLSALRSQLPALEAVTALPDVNALRARPELACLATAAPILVAIDQFEELFMVCRDAQEREGFLAVLAALTGGAKPAGRVVLAVRADFYAECAAQPWLASAISDGHLLVGPMTRTQLRDAIEGPARSVGLELEEGLAERVLADAAGDVGVLPLVAHALVETWLRRVGNQLTIAGYEAAGGVAGAIGRTADDVWKGLDADQQRLARRLLPRLVHPGQGTPDTKRLLTWAELGDDPATGFVLSRFADSRLLTIDDQGVQLAHEALLRTWGTLAAWVEESRDDLRAGERIEDAAREWRRQGQHPDLLYRGLLLATAVDLRGRRDGGIGELADSFLDASTAAREAEESVAEEQSRRLGRTRRRVLLVLATLTVLALVTSVAAVGALGRSRSSESSARAASRLASEQLARGLAASAVGLVPGNPYLATMLAAESVARVSPPLPEAQDALVRSRIALAGNRLVPYGDPIPVGQALAVAVNPPGELAATGNADGTVTVWDLTAREKIAQVSGPRGGVDTLAFTADGRWLVAASSDNRVWRWSLDGRTIGPGSVLADVGSIVWGVAAAPAGSTVAAVTRSGNLLLLNAATGAHQGKPIRGESAQLGSVAFSPDGSSLVATTGKLDGKVFVWSLSSRKLRFAPIRAARSDVAEVIVSPDSATLATVSYGEGAARLWNLTTGSPIGGPVDASDMGVRGVRGVTFGPGGSPLTFGGPDGALYSWSPSRRKVLERAEPVHRARVARAARSTDGLVLVTQGDDQTMQVWTQRPRPGPLTRLATLAARASSIAVAPQGDALAVGADDGAVYLLDSSTGLRRSTLKGHDGPVSAVAFDGASRLVTGDSAGTLRAWDTSTGTVVVEHRNAHRGAVRALAVQGDELLVSGGTDRTVRLWDPRSLAATVSPPAQLQSPVTDVALDADGKTVVASTEHGEIGRWTTAGLPIDVFRVTNDAVWAVALGGDDTLAAAGGDQVLSLWSLADARNPVRTHELGSHAGGALDARFVGAGIVATSAGDGKVRLWDASSGQAIGPPLAVTASPVWDLATSADGSIWAASRDGTVTRIDALALGAACAEANESFDARQRGRLLAGRAPLACGSTLRGPAAHMNMPTMPQEPSYSGPPNACPVEECKVRIVKAERTGTEIRVYFEMNYTPDVKRNHFHVFWDTYTAKQMSLDALQRFGVAVGNWEATADNPYTTSGAAAVRNRGRSTTICVTSGDRNHSVVDANLVACRDVRSLLPGPKAHPPVKR